MISADGGGAPLLVGPFDRPVPDEALDPLEHPSDLIFDELFTPNSTFRVPPPGIAGRPGGHGGMRYRVSKPGGFNTWVAMEVGYRLVLGAARGGQVGGRGPGAVPDRPGRGGSAADGGLGRSGRHAGGPDPPQRQAAGR